MGHHRYARRHDGFNGRCVFGSHLQLHRQGLSFLNQPAGIPDRLFFVYLIAHERHIPYDQRVFATPAYGPGHQDHFIHGHRVKITLGTCSYLVGGLTRTRAYFCRSVLGFTLCLSGNVSNPEAEAAKIVEPHQRDWNTLGFSRQEYWSELPFSSPMHESEVDQSCPTLIDPKLVGCSLPASSVHGIFWARVLEIQL